MKVKDLKRLEYQINKIGCEISNIKHLTIILEEIYINDSGNLSRRDVSALVLVLARMAKILSKQMEKFQAGLRI